MDWKRVDELIEEGFINRRDHPSEPLHIYNYSNKTQIKWHWTPETKACRGLIADHQRNIVARPFEKFFSYEQLNQVVPDEPFEAFEKMDGSLGIVYFAGGKPFVATRGSFDSEQAEKASGLLYGMYGHVGLDPKVTYLVEIIYPGNRIVVDYGSESKLVLLAMIETETGKELPLQDIGLPIAKRYDIDCMDTILNSDESNREGYVLRFDSGQRVKIKFDEYVRYHKIITGLSEKSIWELLRSGQSVEEIMHGIPDEFYEWARGTEIMLGNRFREIRHECRMAFGRRPTGSRKDVAEFFLSHDNKSILFAMLDNKPIDDLIWKAIKPQVAQDHPSE